MLDGHEGKVRDASFNKKGDKVVTASEDNAARIWFVSDGDCCLVLRGHESTVIDASFNSTGDKVVTSAHDGTARIWLVEDGSCLHELAEHEGPIYSGVFNRAGDKVVTASEDGTARIWSVEDGSCIYVLPCHEDGAILASFNRLGDKVVTISEDETVHIWEIDFLERFKRSCTLEQVFLLNAIYEVIKVGRLIELREENFSVVLKNDGKILIKDEVKFDFKNYEAYENDYEALPQAIKDILDPYIIR